MNARVWMVSALVALAAAGCGPRGQAGGGPGGGAMVVKVKAALAAVEPVEEKISLVATISANESVEVMSEIDGTVEQINFEEGQPVKDGQLLIKLDTRKLDAAVAQAEADFNLAEANRQRAETMLHNNTIAQQEYDQAVATFASRKATLDLVKQQLKDARIFAPFGAIAGARLVSPGQVITKSTPLTTLIDIDPVKVEFRVPERFLGQLKSGQTIEFHVAAYAGEVFRGQVYFIDPQVDEDTRTVLVKALQDNTDHRLRPGMFGNLDLILRVREKAVVVPEAALILQGDRTFLYTISDDGTAQPVDVKVGTRMPGKVEIVNGLKGGEQVIAEGIQKVHPGAKVMIDQEVASQPTEG